MKRLRVGVVGCGEAAQIIHLPSLAVLHERFEVTALCDPSRTVVEGVGDRWNVSERFLDHRALLAEAPVDAVLVASPDAFHAETCLDALAAGKHVLVEKPMCITLREADEVAAAQAATERVVQVGYMRRYAPAFLEARDVVHGLDGVRFARVHDVLGLNELIVDQTSRVLRAEDRGSAALAAAQERRAQLVEEAIGGGRRDLEEAYLLLLSLASHDVSAMRELLGFPRRVLYAAARHDSWVVSAAFDYGSFVCDLVAGFDHIPRVDASAAVYGDTTAIRLEFVGSFIRNLPLRLTVTEAIGTAGVTERTVQPSWGDQFVEEWRAFYESVAGERPVKTSPADFRQDLELFAEMVALMR